MKTKQIRITEQAWNELERLNKNSVIDITYTAYVSALILSAKTLGIKVLLKGERNEPKN